MSADAPESKSRRRFIKVAAISSVGLGFGLYVGVGGPRTKTLRESWGEPNGTWYPDAWLQLHPDGSVTVRVNHSEMGQGVTTGLPTLVAEELEVDWQKVRFEIAPVEPVYKNPLFGVQMTGGSTSVPGSWPILREAGALAREILVATAARQWQVPASDCSAQSGVVTHAGSARSIAYGELAATAGETPVPESVELKEPGSFRLIGSDLPRLDIPAKVDGSAVFGIDVDLPGMLIATVVHPPVERDVAASVDDAAARAMPGVRDIFVIETGVAVVADTFWQAKLAADALTVTWEQRGDQSLSSDALWQHWQSLADGAEAKELQSDGDVETALASAAKLVEAEYRVPYEAHMTPEPQNCTVLLEADRCTLWAPTQNQDGAREVAAKVTGLSYDDVEVHTTYLGGGYGRRGSVDFVLEAVRVAMKAGKPIKMIWTREEDTSHDHYRPGSLHRLMAGLDEEGKLVAWQHRIVGQDPMAALLPTVVESALPHGTPRGLRNMGGCAGRKLLPAAIGGAGVKNGAAPLGYAVDNIHVDWVDDGPNITVGFWRSVANGANGFVVESFIEEVAAAAGRDSVALRRELLAEEPRYRKTLDRVLEAAGWDQPAAEGISRGVALHEFHKAIVAMVAEVRVVDDAIRVERVVAAVDCGVVINPRIVADQVAGGIAFALSATLLSRTTWKDGRVEQSNFDDYPIIAMEQMPEVEVVTVDSDEDPNGIGEVGVPALAPAVANAVFAATGKRLRELPLRLS